MISLKKHAAEIYTIINMESWLFSNQIYFHKHINKQLKDANYSFPFFKNYLTLRLFLG